MPGEFSAEQISLPFAFLADCAGSKAEPVTLQQESPAWIIARCHEAGYPEVRQPPASPDSLSAALIAVDALFMDVEEHDGLFFLVLLVGHPHMLQVK